MRAFDEMAYIPKKSSRMCGRSKAGDVGHLHMGHTGKAQCILTLLRSTCHPPETWQTGTLLENCHEPVCHLPAWLQGSMSLCLSPLCRAADCRPFGCRVALAAIPKEAVTQHTNSTE